MRTLVIAAAAATLAFGGGAADAQRLGNNGAPAGGWRGVWVQPWATCSATVHGVNAVLTTVAVVSVTRSHVFVVELKT